MIEIKGRKDREKYPKNIRTEKYKRYCNFPEQREKSLRDRKEIKGEGEGKEGTKGREDK